MKLLALISCMWLLSCASVSTVGYEVRKDTHLVQRTMTDRPLFGSTVQRSWLELCEATPVKDPYISEPKFIYSKCRRQSEVKVTD